MHVWFSITLQGSSLTRQVSRSQIKGAGKYDIGSPQQTKKVLELVSCNKAVNYGGIATAGSLCSLLLFRVVPEISVYAKRLLPLIFSENLRCVVSC